MDLWIRRDAERTVAAGAALLAALLPWDVTYIGDIAGGSLLYVRFPFVEFQWADGIQSASPATLRLVQDAAALHTGGPLEPAYQAYVVGAAAVALALVLAAGLAATEGRDGGLNPTRVVGGLLGVGGLAFVAGWYLVFTRGAAGLDVPLGAVIVPALGVTLLVAERR